MSTRENKRKTTTTQCVIIFLDYWEPDEFLKLSFENLQVSGSTCLGGPLLTGTYHQAAVLQQRHSSDALVVLHCFS